MNFGVSGSIGACSSHIYSNPVTVAAVARQREKERLANDPAYRSAKERMERIKAQVAADLEIKEERFRREFLYDIAKLRALYQRSKPDFIKIKEVEVQYNAGSRTKASEIIKYHSWKSGYAYDVIIGASRCQDVFKVRCEAIADTYLLCPHLSLPQIGEAFGGRDHTTILYVVRKMGVHHLQTGKERRMGNYISLRVLAA